MTVISSAFAEYEKVGDRAPAGHRPSRQGPQGGKSSGSYPFGWSKDGPVEREQAVLSVIKTMLTNGDGFAEIARYLNSRPDHQPRRAERWTRQTVAAVAGRAGLPSSKTADRLNMNPTRDRRGRPASPELVDQCEDCWQSDSPCRNV
jgi:hypothetical protein